MEPFQYTFHSPIGPLGLVSTEEQIIAIDFDAADWQEERPLPDILQQCIEELEAYFAGSLRTFDFPLEQPGTPFQQTVWNQLLTIPYGSTITYMQLAHQIGNPKSIRAVGTTNGRNHIPIVVPCHRVIGSNGKLVGFGGGLWRKKWLLEHEQKHRYGTQELF